MTDLLPWLAIAGLGTVHGLSPANGWMFAAAWGVRADNRQVRRALLPIGLGHAVSIAVVAGAFAQGLSMDRALVANLADALLIGAPAAVPGRQVRPGGSLLRARWFRHWPPSASTWRRCWSPPASLPPACAAVSPCTLAC